MSNKFMLGTRVAIKATFTDKSDQLVDPANVKFYIKDPAGQTTEHAYPGAAGTSRESTGIFWFQYKPTVAGTFRYRAEGSGGVDAAGEGTFIIQTSNVLAPPT